MIWAYPTTSAKMPHAFPTAYAPSLCRRYYLAAIELMEVVKPEEQNRLCASCKRAADKITDQEEPKATTAPAEVDALLDVLEAAPGDLAYSYLARDEDNQDQPPEVDIHDDARQHADPAAAAARVLEFVGWFGDGQIWHAEHDGPTPPLYARDLEALARTALHDPTAAEVDAAAVAIYQHARPFMNFPTDFQDAPRPLQATYRGMARAALEAGRK